MNDEILLNERVQVIAAFGDGLNPCRPIKFRRANGRSAEEAADDTPGEGGRMMRYSELDGRLLFLKDSIILEDGYDYTLPLWPTEDEVQKDG